MVKWGILLVVVVALAAWLYRGKRMRTPENPEAKQLDQKRFYVTPPEKDDTPPDDTQGTRL